MTNVEEVSFFKRAAREAGRLLTAAEVLQHYQVGETPPITARGLTSRSEEPISLKAKVNRGDSIAARSYPAEALRSPTPTSPGHRRWSILTFSAEGFGKNLGHYFEALGQSSEGNAFSYALSGQWVSRLGTEAHSQGCWDLHGHGSSRRHQPRAFHRRAGDSSCGPYPWLTGNRPMLAGGIAARFSASWTPQRAATYACGSSVPWHARPGCPARHLVVAPRSDA